MITRAQAETVLIGRRGPLMEMVSLDHLTVDGTNPDLNDPLGYAVRALEGTVTNLLVVADADIDTAVVESEDVDMFLEIAELRLLMNIKGNFDLININVGPFDERYTDLLRSLQQDIETLSKRYMTQMTRVSAGVIDQNFASHDDDI